VIREQWNGDEWQEHCCRLLAARHGVEIQFIPDRGRGDGGLEAYTFDGVGYQCYAPDEAYSTASLTTAQKGKINRDIKRLSKDPAGTKKLLGTLQLRKWVLLTPDFDSRTLVEHARALSEGTRNAPRPDWCHADFEIVIATDDLFAAERGRLYGQLADGLHLDVAEPDDDELFRAAAGGVADTLTRKLAVEPMLGASSTSLAAYRSSLLIDYVRGQQQLEILANDYGSLHAVVARRFTSTLRGLGRELPGVEGSGPVVIETLLRRLSDNLHADAPALHQLLCDELARFAVALWFVQCPLYFPRGDA
jgi:hypothetical protein